MERIKWSRVLTLTTAIALVLFVGILFTQTGCGGEDLGDPEKTEKGEPEVVEIIKLVPKECPAPEEKTCPVCAEIECVVEKVQVCDCKRVIKKCNKKGICHFRKNGCHCETIEQENCYVL